MTSSNMLATRPRCALVAAVLIVAGAAGLAAPAAGGLDRTGSSALTVAEPHAGERGSVVNGQLRRHGDLKRRAFAERELAEMLGRDAAGAGQSFGPGSATAQLAAAGLSLDHPDSEMCALYAAGRLDAEARAVLAGHGIEVYPTWVPAVPGRHALGFHLARVPYAVLDLIETDPALSQIVRGLEGVEAAINTPQDDVAADFTRARGAWDGLGGVPVSGAGVLIAVADSSLDVDHDDMPPESAVVETWDVTDGPMLEDWTDDVSSTVSEHGTHVTGTVLGRGTASGGRYRGAAWGADLAFYKIGGDGSAGASGESIIKAVTRAAEIDADVFTMSYGGRYDFGDGSSATEQVFDAATATGMVTICSAGNDANDLAHDSVLIEDGVPGEMVLLIDNSFLPFAYDVPVAISVVWSDGDPAVTGNDVVETFEGDSTLFNVSVEPAEPLADGESFGSDEGVDDGLPDFFQVSPRGTERALYVLTPDVPAFETRAYRLRLSNDDASAVRVHAYHRGDFSVSFGDPDPEDDELRPDPGYTVTGPATADTVIAVGAFAHRQFWTARDGRTFGNSQTVGTRATFSSIGPRVDEPVGIAKPLLLAPGAAMISWADSLLPVPVGASVYNDLNGDGEHDEDISQYRVLQGTSMAAPWVAGCVALLLEAEPGLTPEQVRQRLGFSAAAMSASVPDPEHGFGLIDILSTLLVQPGAGGGVGQLVAIDQTLSGRAGRETQVTLRGLGLLGEPAYAIESLPSRGTLFAVQDAGEQEITSVPFALDGDQVVYVASSFFTGTDSFDFSVDDIRDASLPPAVPDIGTVTLELSGGSRPPRVINVLANRFTRITLLYGGTPTEIERVPTQNSRSFALWLQDGPGWTYVDPSAGTTLASDGIAWVRPVPDYSGSDFVTVLEQGDPQSLSLPLVRVNESAGPAADLNLDGLVNVFDILEFFQYFGAGHPIADFFVGQDGSGAGELNLFDIVRFLEVHAAGSGQG